MSSSADSVQDAQTGKDRFIFEMKLEK